MTITLTLGNRYSDPTMMVGQDPAFWNLFFPVHWRAHTRATVILTDTVIARASANSGGTENAILDVWERSRLTATTVELCGRVILGQDSYKLEGYALEPTLVPKQHLPATTLLIQMKTTRGTEMRFFNVHSGHWELAPTAPLPDFDGYFGDSPYEADGSMKKLLMKSPMRWGTLPYRTTIHPKQGLLYWTWSPRAQQHNKLYTRFPEPIPYTGNRA